MRGFWANTALSVLLAALLTGCIFGSHESFVPKPQTLSPEASAFAAGPTRTYEWTEGLRAGGRDTLLGTGTLDLTHAGDTTLGGPVLKRVTVDYFKGTGTGILVAPPAAILARLGLNPTKLYFDTALIPDPGPALRFPDTPRVGWRLDTTVENLRHVREVTGLQVQKVGGERYECWVIADSVFWGTDNVSTETFWMGVPGLVRHRQEFADYIPAGITGGTLWREIKAK